MQYYMSVLGCIVTMLLNPSRQRKLAAYDENGYSCSRAEMIRELSMVWHVIGMD